MEDFDVIEDNNLYCDITTLREQNVERPTFYLDKFVFFYKATREVMLI